MYITISALTMEEAETMLKILDKWLRHFFNTYGVRRDTSFNRRANDNIRAQIRGEIDKAMWDEVYNGVMREVTHRFEKGTSYHIEKISDTLKVIDFCTCESAL